MISLIDTARLGLRITVAVLAMAVAITFVEQANRPHVPKIWAPTAEQVEMERQVMAAAARVRSQTLEEVLRGDI